MSSKHLFSTYSDAVLSHLLLQVNELVVDKERLWGRTKQVHWLVQILMIYYINMELQQPVPSVSDNMEDWSLRPISQHSILLYIEKK